MKQRTHVLGIILVAALVLVVGCSTATPDSQLSPLTTPATEGAAPTSEPASLTPEPPAVLVEGLPFSLDEPLAANATQVSGTGPIGVPIVIADLTFMGEILGRDTIGPDGLFDIQLGAPLVVNHRIGIMLDAEATEFEFTQEILDQIEAFKGDEAIALPRIGTAYDAASVGP